MYKIIIAGIAGLGSVILGLFKECLPKRVFVTIAIILFSVIAIFSIWVGIDTYPKPFIPPKLSVHNEYVRILNSSIVTVEYDTLSNSYTLLPTLLNEGPGVAKGVKITISLPKPPIDSVKGPGWKITKTKRDHSNISYQYPDPLLAQTTEMTDIVGSSKLSVFLNPMFRDTFVNKPNNHPGKIKIEGLNIPSTQIVFYIEYKTGG